MSSENIEVELHESLNMSQSKTIGELAKALSKAQSQLKGAKKENEQSHYGSKYADLESCWEACRNPLAENDLAITQTNGGTVDNPSIITTLMHASGEWIRGELFMIPEKKGPQGVGSVITYARRYGLCGIVGISPLDDDAEGAENHDKPDTVENEKFTPKIEAQKHRVTNEGVRLITIPQAGRFKAIAREKNWSEDDLFHLYTELKIDGPSEIVYADYKGIIERLEDGPPAEIPF